MAHYHISDYELHWARPWAYWQRVMIDAPKYEFDGKESPKIGENTIIKPEDEKDIFEYLQRQIKNG